jgi:hypothetical protein
MTFISGRRKDLTRVRDPGSLTALVVGAGVASLDGLPAMTALEELHLEGGRDRDLELLRRLPKLRRLSVLDLGGRADLSALASLTTLEALWATLVEPEHVSQFAALDFGALPAMERLLVDQKVAPAPTLAAGAFASSSRWIEVKLEGILVSDDDLTQLLGSAPRLQSLEFTPQSEQQEARARELGRRRDIVVLTGNDAMPQLGKIVRAGAPGQFVVPLDLRERFGVENNAQASDALQAWLERRQPALSERYELDPESSAVWIYASSEADLQRLMDLLGCG